MGILSAILGFVGFGVGTSTGLVIGYYVFIYFLPTDVKNPAIRPLVEQDSKTLQRLLPEIPMWVKNPDYDRVDWLNKFIELMWPYLDKAICKTARTIAKPIIAEQIPKYKIDSVKFEALSLGTLPPTFQGIKVYVTGEKELIMELQLKWAGNPNILVAAKAFGLKATVQVVDLQVFACPRITLKPLVSAFPCFSKIFVSLMEKVCYLINDLQPHVDFGLKLLGADAMAIPGLYRFVQELIKEQVANMYLWPKALEVQIMDPTLAMRKPVGILHIKVLKAMKLKKKDFLGGADPYVKIKLTEDKLPSKKTTVKHGTLDPEWNEEFNFDGMMANPSIHLSIYQSDSTGPLVKKNRDPRWEEEFQFILEEPPKKERLHAEVVSHSSRMGLLHPKETLGYVDIDLADVVSNRRINEKYHLIDSKNGRLQLELQWRTAS
ncbi:hypothetical protein C1H46_006891 [Malus baccata]|uniref:C2 domain-containing protein n=1 Tax=Malus baccata TaxID=106549 RepID=A0A540N943_MALBA|nr:hypothetical protein C1H46_006891 [Malus baccata]